MSTSASLVPTSKRRDFLRRSITRYSQSVEQGEQYLASRGIDLETAREWQLGVVVEPVSGHEMFAGRLAIPYLTPAGPVGLVFRCIEPHDCSEHGGTKYLAETGERRRLFNVGALAVDSRKLVMTEGEVDALVSHALADVPAVGVPGVNNWSDHFKYLFDGYDEVILVADGDEPGKKLASTVRNALDNLRIVVMPAGHDPNSYICTYGADAYRSFIEWDSN